MKWFLLLAGFWWRWLLVWTFLLGTGLCVIALLPWTPWLPSLQITAHSPNQASTPINQPLQIQFSAPMDRASAEAALAIEPALSGTWQWHNDYQATWLPTVGWQPNTAYTATISSHAQSVYRQRLTQQYQWHWATVSGPVVVATWPATQQPLANLNTPLLITFDRPLIQTSDPAISLQPPQAFSQQWIDDSTIEIAIDWQPATTYTVTISNLQDHLQTPIAPYEWRVTTAPLNVQSIYPEPRSRVSHDSAVSFSIQGFLPFSTVDSLTQSLTLTPAYSGTWDINYADSGTTEFRFTPFEGWQEQTIQARLAVAGSPVYTWQWEVIQPLQLVASVPGRNATLVPNEDVRLIFAAPPDLEIIQQGLSIQPEVTNLQIQPNQAEIRLQADWAEHTAYTITFQPRSDVVPIRIPFQTTDLSAKLSMSEPVEAISHSTPERLQSVTLKSTTPTAMLAALYPLDRAFFINNLRAHSQPHLIPTNTLQAIQTWTIAETSSATLSFTAPAGIYVFEAQDSQQQQVVQKVFIVSNAHVELVTHNRSALAYIFDAETGEPRPNTEFILLHNGSQVAQGSTNESGLWQGTFTSQTLPDTIISAQNQDVFFADSDQLPTQHQAIQLFGVQQVVHQGARLILLGYNDTTTTSPSIFRLYDPQNHVVDQQSVSPTAQHVLSLEWRIRSSYTPGAYRVEWDQGSYTFYVEPPFPENWQLFGPDNIVAGATTPFTLRFQTIQGLPYAQRAGTWRVSTQNQYWQAEGKFLTDVSGMTQIDVALPLTLTSELVDLQVDFADQQLIHTLLVKPAVSIELQTNHQIAQPNATLVLTATVRNQLNQPLSNQMVELSIRGNAAPELLQARTNAAGVVVFNWRLRGNGTFTFEARSNQVVAQQIVWVSQLGFQGWATETQSAESVHLVVDRAVVQPGEEIQILPILNTLAAEARIVYPGADGMQISEQAWVAGVPLRVVLDQQLRGSQEIVVWLNKGNTVWRATVQVEQREPHQLLLPEQHNQFQVLSVLPMTYTVWYGQALQPEFATLVDTNTLRLRPDWALLQVVSNGTSEVRLNPIQSQSMNNQFLIPADLQVNDRVTVYTLGPDPLSNSELRANAMLQVVRQPVIETTVPNTAWSLKALSSGKADLYLGISNTVALTQQLVIQPPVSTAQQWHTRLITSDGSLVLPALANQIVFVPGSANLRLILQQHLTQNQTPLARAGRVAIAQSNPASRLATTDIAYLIATQHADGGWSWDNSDSDPLLTALVARFLATGTRTQDVQHILDRAMRWLAGYPLETLDIHIQAAIYAAQARYQTIDSQTLLALLEDPRLDGMYQLLVVQALLDQRLDRRAEQLFAGLNIQHLLNIKPSTTAWESMPAQAALLGQITWQLDPQRVDVILEFIQANWNPQWNDSFALTELVLWLQQLPQTTSNPQRYTVQADAAVIYSGIHTKYVQLAPTYIPTLTVSLADQQQLIVSYTQPTTDTDRLQLRVRDARTNQPLTRAELGQQIRLDWTWYSATQQSYVDLVLPQLSTLEYGSIDAPNFVVADTHLYAKHLEPGVYTISVLAYPTFEGVFHWASPRLQTSHGERSLLVAAWPLEIQ